MIIGSYSSSRTRSSLVGKYRNTVLGDTSAASATCSTVVASYPWVVNSRTACSWMVRLVRAFLRSRTPALAELMVRSFLTSRPPVRGDQPGGGQRHHRPRGE